MEASQRLLWGRAGNASVYKEQCCKPGEEQHVGEVGKGEVGAQGSWAAGLHWEEKSGESGGSLQAESQEALKTCEPLSCGAEAPGKLGAQ